MKTTTLKAFACTMALLLFLPLTVAGAQPDISPAEARAIAKEAYIYGFPLVDNYRTLYVFGIDRTSPVFKAPFNVLHNEARLLSPEDRTVVTPNSDTLYSSVTFDLRAEPMVLTLPAIGKERYYSVQMVDLYTFNFDYLGSRTTGNNGGNFLVAGPNWKGEAPKGIAKVVRAETEIVVALTRTQLFGPGDMENVRKVQAGYKARPLSAFLGQPAPKASPAIVFIKPLPATAQRTSLEFFNILRFVLELCPIHPTEKDLRARFAKIGIVPGKPFDVASLTPEMKEALHAGMADGQQAIESRRAAGGGKTADLFGTREYLKNDYLARATGAQAGIFGNSKEEAFYQAYDRDAEGQALDAGKYNYVVRLASGQLPPARAFWSLTMYDLPGQFLVANPLNRYLINSPMLPDLKRDADGGLTLYIQRESPGKDKEPNWLPAPNGPFMMTMRIYWPKPEVLDGTWKAPPLVRVNRAGADAPKDAQPATQQANTAVLKELDFADREDFEDARRGLIAPPTEAIIKAADGHVVWDLDAYAFLKKEEAPATVNPSLWRQARINLVAGLFKVVDRVYQVRGLDLSNMTIIEGDKGVILIDPLITAETARAGLDLYYQHRDKRPVVAVIYTHSHVDHFGGVKGVVDEADVKAGKVGILAPERFLEAAISENVTAGTAMGRRSGYWYGTVLPRGERGQVDAGLGKAPSIGSVTLIPPTDTITKTGEQRLIDGVKMVFHMTPDTEAPAEMMIHFPQFKVFDSAELACHTLHNVLTLRGAQVRDAAKWSRYLNEAIDTYGNETEVLIAQHHWPRWGHDRSMEFLKDQRDMYKYVHDQTLRLANQGYTMTEIGPMLAMPPGLARKWYARGYYGTVNHDAKAVYQKYLGWYDMNPANLNPLPPVESSRKYVEYMGGAQAVMTRAREDFGKGEYRWVAQTMNHVVFADPGNQEARNLQADALEQLGYQAEAATWRNNYLTAAYELRKGVPALPASASSSDVITALTVPMIFDFMGVRLNGPKADGKVIVINWDFTDIKEKYVLRLENSALTYMPYRQAPKADATITLTRAAFDAMTLGKTTFEKEIMAGRLKVEGDGRKFGELLGLLDTFKGDFNIVTP